MTLRTNWEGRMKRWAAGMRKEEWSARDGMGWDGGWGVQFACVQELKLRGKLRTPYVKFCKRRLLLHT